MTWLSWLIVIVPMVCILWAAFHSKRYVKDVADYLACGRVAGRYVISVGDMAAGLSVISLVAACEANYQVGIAYHFWGAINTPIAVLLALSGYCVYRFRQTRCLSIGQFLELRYSRSFRMVAATIRTSTRVGRDDPIRVTSPYSTARSRRSNRQISSPKRRGRDRVTSREALSASR